MLTHFWISEFFKLLINSVILRVNKQGGRKIPAQRIILAFSLNTQSQSFLFHPCFP